MSRGWSRGWLRSNPARASSSPVETVGTHRGCWEGLSRAAQGWTSQVRGLSGLPATAGGRKEGLRGPEAARDSEGKCNKASGLEEWSLGGRINLM